MPGLPSTCNSHQGLPHPRTAQEIEDDEAGQRPLSQKRMKQKAFKSLGALSHLQAVEHQDQTDDMSRRVEGDGCADAFSLVSVAKETQYTSTGRAADLFFQL